MIPSKHFPRVITAAIDERLAARGIDADLSLERFLAGLGGVKRRRLPDLRRWPPPPHRRLTPIPLAYVWGSS